MPDTLPEQDRREWTTEPPSQRRPRRDWTGTVADLRAHQGEWTIVDTDTRSPGLTSHIRHGNLVAFRPAGAFEARSTKKEGGVYDIYARYVGEPEQSDAE